MHPNKKFQLHDRDEMRAIVCRLAFGILVAQTESGLRAVHVPVVIEGDRLLFHVSRGNALHSALAAGCEGIFVATGPHSYVSPEDYGLEDRVPTWSYVAVELNGPVRPIDEDGLVRLLDSMSAEQEAALAPKLPWTREELSPGRFDGLLKSITGFEMEISGWRGTAKLDQDKPEPVRARLAQAFAGRGATDMASLMLTPSPNPAVS